MTLTKVNLDMPLIVSKNYIVEDHQVRQHTTPQIIRISMHHTEPLIVSNITTCASAYVHYVL